MVDFLFIILLVVYIVFIGTISYLIYLPLKYRLKKSGKLTGNLNRRINQIFLITIIIIALALYFFKDYRTSSKSRLERVSDINLPSDFKVIKDMYVNNLRDYCINYDIQFNKKAVVELVNRIKSSKFYNSNISSNTLLYDSLYVKIDDEKALWCISEKGYRFNRNDGLTIYSITLDTSTNILYYMECTN